MRPTHQGWTYSEHLTSTDIDNWSQATILQTSSSL